MLCIFKYTTKIIKVSIFYQSCHIRSKIIIEQFFDIIISWHPWIQYTSILYTKGIDLLWVVVEVEIVSEVITNQRKVGEIGQNLEADLDPEVVLTGKESDTHG